MTDALIDIIRMLLTVLTWLVIAQMIISWLIVFNVINTYNDFVRQLNYALSRIIDPLLNPIRRILPDFGGLDFSPMVLLLLIWIVQRLLLQVKYTGMAL
jgi:YggT family protein